LGRVEKSIIIKAPPEKVWEMLAFDRLLEWQVGFDKAKSIEYTSEVGTLKDKYKVGASAHGTPKKQGESIKLNFEITESLEKKKISHRIYENIFGGTFTVLATYILEPVGAETKFTYSGHYEMPWGFFGKFLDKLFIHRMAEKDLGTELDNLKSILEK
jgi:carbon monoxide dehydrogenase subunit G